MNEEIAFNATVALQANGALAELGIVMYGGREFPALGSVIDPGNGLIIGYVCRVPASTSSPASWELATWEGKHIASLELRGIAYGFRDRCGRRSEIHCFAMLYCGIRYAGRIGLDWNQCITMRKAKDQSTVHACR